MSFYLAISHKRTLACDEDWNDFPNHFFLCVWCKQTSLPFACIETCHTCMRWWIAFAQFECSIMTPLSSAVDVEIKVLNPLIVSLSSQFLLSSLKMRFVSGKSPELCAFVRMKNYPNVRSTLSRGWEQGGRNCGILDMKICIFEIFPSLFTS